MLEVKIMNNNCPCCSTQMFRHARSQKVYWFCPSCYQEMPNLTEIIVGRQQERNQLVSTKLLLELKFSQARV